MQPDSFRNTYFFWAEWTSTVKEFSTYNWKSNNIANLRGVLETSTKFILKLTVEEAATRR